MNGRERLQAALRGEPTDRVPVMLHHFMQAAAEDGLTMQQFRDDPARAAHAFLRSAEKYDLDGLLIDVDTALLAGACGVPIDFPENDPARCAGPLLRRLEDIRHLPPPDIARDRRIQATVEIARLIKAQVGDTLAVRGNADQCAYSLASMMRGPEEWMMDLLDPDAEELVFRLLDHACAATCQFLDLMAGAGSHILSNGDSPAGPDLISPALYRKYALPYERRIAAHARSLGCDYILHICGNTNLILEDVATVGASGFEIDYKTDMRVARRVLRDRVTFIGNVDPSGVLARGCPELVERTTRQLLDVFAGEPRFILNAGCAIPPTAPEANIRALLRAADR